MKKHVGIIVLLALVLMVLLISTVTFRVDQTTDIVIVTRFGKVNRVYTGEKPGLHMKWLYPIERVITLDSRNNLIESEYKQTVIAEQLNVMASAFCTWRIRPGEDAARQFYSWQKSTKVASERIKSQIASELEAELGKRNMSELVNTEASQVKLAEIAENVRTKVQQQLDVENAGVELTDVGIDNLGVPKTISEAIIEQVKADRQKEAQRLRAEGESRARAIVGIAESARDKILAFANRKAKDIETQGDAKAAESYAQLNEDPAFAIALRMLESSRTMLSGNTEFLLDTTMLPILQWMRTPASMQSFQDALQKADDQR